MSKTRPLYSFDDNHIGRLKDDGRSLATHEIPRPPGVGRQAWYQHAGNIVRIINNLPISQLPEDGS